METLAAITGYLQLLLEGWDSMSDSQRRDAVQLALDAARRGSPT